MLYEVITQSFRYDEGSIGAPAPRGFLVGDELHAMPFPLQEFDSHLIGKAAHPLRITSYNVCYTKLLRFLIRPTKNLQKMLDFPFFSLELAVFSQIQPGTKPAVYSLDYFFRRNMMLLHGYGYWA